VSETGDGINRIKARLLGGLWRFDLRYERTYFRSSVIFVSPCSVIALVAGPRAGTRLALRSSIVVLPRGLSRTLTPPFGPEP
jgi:hypothetical protein